MAETVAGGLRFGMPVSNTPRKIYTVHGYRCWEQRMNAPASCGGVGPPSREFLSSTVCTSSGVVALVVPCTEAQAREVRGEASGSHGDTAGTSGGVDANSQNRDPGEITKHHMDGSAELIELISSSFGESWVSHCE